MTINEKQQAEEQVVLNLNKITDLTTDSKTALRMLAVLYEVKL